MNYNKFFSKIGFNYLALAIVCIIFQIIIANIISLNNPELLNDINIVTIISAICNYILPLPIIYYLMKKIESTKIKNNTVNIITYIKYISITILLMWIGNIIGLIITFLIGNITQTDILNPVEQLISNSDIIMNLLIISIIAPIFEELFFRKFLIDRTIKYGAKVSIITSALLFAFFHGNLNQFFYAFLMGGFFAYVYIKTGKIIYTIGLHFIVNLMGSVISIIFTNSLEALINGTSGNLDMAIVLLYVIIILTALLIGILTLAINYKKEEIVNEKRKIAIKEIILNPGMICFIFFFTIEIIYTLT